GGVPMATPVFDGAKERESPPGGTGQQGVTAGRTKKPPKGGFFAGDTAYLSIACRNEGAM
ncbi:hypothetical protein, partial [Pseudomonas aeruginosa]|uniref:hypothetical protein n=1 Tax=Pseudomonas aeruginosa TaxID=287 RepID=UPI00396961AD